MLPKNTLRKGLIEKHVKIFHGPYHNLDHINLPQFTETANIGDVNEDLGLDGFNKDNTTIIYNTNENGELPEEFKDYNVEIDESIAEPLGYRKKTHT